MSLYTYYYNDPNGNRFETNLLSHDRKAVATSGDRLVKLNPDPDFNGNLLQIDDPHAFQFLIHQYQHLKPQLKRSMTLWLGFYYNSKTDQEILITSSHDSNIAYVMENLFDYAIQHQLLTPSIDPHDPDFDIEDELFDHDFDVIKLTMDDVNAYAAQFKMLSNP